MGRWGLGWFMDDEIAKLKAFRVLLTTKEQKDALDAHIAELEAKRKSK